MNISVSHAKFTRVNFLAVTVLTLTALSFFLAQQQFALAHSRFKSANIQPNAVVTSVPATLTVNFTEETSQTQTKLQVLDSSGKQVDKGDLKVNGATATISLGSLQDGQYTVKYRTLTEDDGGIVDGQYNFSVAKSGTASSGDVSKATENESKTTPSGAPASGMGGTSSDSSGSFELVFGLAGLGFLAVTILLIVQKRVRQQ
ncbi:MAG TPA: copper resistance CopC family protein [Chloroflexia bacterium]|nr:copper resistance CopC family protein [Chloroflexia bacterium]